MQTLKALIEKSDPVITTLVSNPLMAKLAEQAGFNALYLGGGMLGYTKVFLEVRGKKVPANVCNLPFYKKNYFKGEINV